MHRIEGENAQYSVDGKSSFKSSPPYTMMTPEWANAVQEEIMYAIEQAGLPLLGQNNDTRQQLYQAMRSNIQSYDYFVNSQQAFVNLFERTGANAYRIKSDYSSVFVKKVTGGYSVAGILSGGDTWGDISTNTCEHLEFQNGAYINFAAMKGNLTVDTDGCYLHNVDIRGNGATSVTVESFKLNAYRVTFDNCKCSNRLSSVAMTGFQGSGTAAHNYTSKYVNCTAYTLDNSGAFQVSGFKDCINLSGCMTYDLDVSLSTGSCIGFSSCKNLSSCFAYSINSSAVGSAVGFYDCKGLSSCYADTVIGAVATTVAGFTSCFALSGCIAINISGATNGQGFSSCDTISGCRAETINGNTLGYGFYACVKIAACSSESITGATNEGFHQCTYGAALYTSEAANAGNDWMNTDDAQITNKFSTPACWT